MNYLESLTIKEYFVVEQDNGSSVFVEYYQTAGEALIAAGKNWGRLTKAEQKRNTVSAWQVIRENIQPDLVDEDRPWWEATADRQGNVVTFRATL